MYMYVLQMYILHVYNIHTIHVYVPLREELSQNHSLVLVRSSTQLSNEHEYQPVKQ